MAFQSASPPAIQYSAFTRTAPHPVFLEMGNGSSFESGKEAVNGTHPFRADMTPGVDFDSDSQEEEKASAERVSSHPVLHTKLVC